MFRYKPIAPMKPIIPKNKEHKELIRGRISFEDYQFQVDLKHIEYVNVERRTSSFPHFDYSKTKDKWMKQDAGSKFWLGYTDNVCKLIHPEWVEEGTIIKGEDDLLFPREFQKKVKDNVNKKVILANEIKANLEECAKESSFHPGNKIESVRRKFDVDKNKARWQGKTVDGTDEFLEDDWVVGNIYYPNRKWYNDTLKYQNDKMLTKDAEEEDWIPL